MTVDQRADASTEVALETCKGFWLLDDKFAFHNVGFSHAVGDLRYLTCADCEVGPIGYHTPAEPNSFYVAANRISYL